MNFSDAVLFAVCGLAAAGIVGWMVLLTARLKAIERALQTVVDNTHALREIVRLLGSVDRNTSLLGGIGNVFGSKDRNKPR